MENVKLNAEEYVSCGLGDIYYGLISFIGRYAEQNYSPIEIFDNGTSKYRTAIITMKSSLKTLLEYLKTTDTVFIPSLNRNINLNLLNQEEQLALEERCREFILENLNIVMNYELEEKSAGNKSRT